MKWIEQEWLPADKKIITTEDSLKNDLLWLLKWPGWIYAHVHIAEVSKMSSYAVMSDDLPVTLMPSFLKSDVISLRIDVISAVLDNQQRTMLLQYKTVEDVVLGRGFALEGDLAMENQKGVGWSWVK